MSVSVYKSEEGRKAINSVYEALLSSWPVEKKESIVNTAYGDTFILESGASSLPPMVLLHGSSSNSAMWIGDIARYSKLYRVYAIDLPGEPGKSSDIRPDLITDAYADWLNEVFVKLNISKAVIIGISLGGWAALKFSVKFSEKVSRLALLCPAGIGPQRAAVILAALPLRLLGRKGEILAIKKVMGIKDLADETIEYSMLISKNFRPYMGTIPIFKDEELHRLNMPVLLIAGDKDALFDSKTTISRARVSIPQAETVLLTGAGHGLIDQRDRILTFLSK
jgi:pimeloyl-ACP methyl ester carboxylesterase